MSLFKTPTQEFFYEYCKILKNSIFDRTPPVATSKLLETVVSHDVSPTKTDVVHDLNVPLAIQRKS